MVLTGAEEEPLASKLHVEIYPGPIPDHLLKRPSMPQDQLQRTQDQKKLVEAYPDQELKTTR